MKKILLVVLALILVALPLTACDNNDDNKIIVNETTHSIFLRPAIPCNGSRLLRGSRL